MYMQVYMYYMYTAQSVVATPLWVVVTGRLDHVGDEGVALPLVLPAVLVASLAPRRAANFCLCLGGDVGVVAFLCRYTHICTHT